MTPEERTLLQTFLSDLGQSRAMAKDAEAETMINQALAQIPDGAYLLVQHAILADQALHQAQSDNAALQAQLRPASANSGGFLGQNAGAPYSGQGYAPQNPAPWNPPQPQSAPFLGGGPLSAGSGLGGFLRTAGTMAVGVAGGNLLFDGIANLFGGGHQGGFGGGGYGGGNETIVNNYYDDDNGGGGSDDSGSDN